MASQDRNIHSAFIRLRHTSNYIPLTGSLSESPIAEQNGARSLAAYRVGKVMYMLRMVIDVELLDSFATRVASVTQNAIPPLVTTS